MAASVPQIVYSHVFSQSSNISNVALFTPLQTGLFRLSMYVVNPSVVPSGIGISYTDDNGAQSDTFSLGNNDTGYSFIIEATSASAITITSYGAGTQPWVLYFTIEAL